MAANIVLSCDRNVLWGLAVTVLSALDAASDRVNIYILAVDFTPQDKQKLLSSWVHPNCGEIAFIDLSKNLMQKFRSTKYLRSKSTYARFFLAALPQTVTRCIYLDTDLLVFKDVCALDSLDLQGNGIAAVRDVSVRTKADHPKLLERLGIAHASSYFNSGLLVIDLDAWRKDNIEDKLIEVSISKFDLLDSQDQDVLNIVFEGKTLFLDVPWNISQYEKPDVLDGHVTHLIGSIKPWNARYRAQFIDPYFRDVTYATFFSVLDRTAFAGGRPKYLGGFGAVLEKVEANFPTRDMLIGKVRRTLRKLRRVVKA